MQQTARAAVLTAPKTFEIREYPIPAIGDDEMLIKVEACGVCGTDGHEYNRDPFGLCPVVLGHEGTGEIVAMGRMLFDFGYTAYLGDVIVRPEYQGQGIGKRIVENLIDRTMDSAHEGEWIMFILGAAKNKEPFYEKLGFQKRPNETSGGGMSMYRTKQKRR